MNSGTDGMAALADNAITTPGGWKKYYAYPMVFAAIPIAAGSQVQVNLQIQDDAPFYWQATGAEVVDTTFNVVVSTNITLQLTDRGANFPIYPQGVPLNLVAGLSPGGGGLPYVLPVPYRFERNSTINGVITNNSSNANVLTITLLLHGFKLFTPAPVN